MSTEPDQQFDPLKYKETTREQWQTAAEPWHRWGPTLEEWLGQATEVMLEMAEVASALACSTWLRVPEDRLSRQPSAQVPADTCWQRTSPPTSSSSPPQPHKKKV
jgi:hypothetical protein